MSDVRTAKTGLPALRFDRNELAGAFGDVGTDIPLIIPLLTVPMGLDPRSVLMVFGACLIFSGLPKPVTPSLADFLPALLILAIPQLPLSLGNAVLATLRYWHNPEIDVNMLVMAFLVLGALGGTLVGTELAARLEMHWLRKAFAIFMVIVAIKMFTMPSRCTDAPSDGTDGATTSAVQTKGPGNG